MVVACVVVVVKVAVSQEWPVYPVDKKYKLGARYFSNS